MAESTQEMEQILDKYMAIYNERDYSKIPDVVSESIVRVSPVGEVRGHDGFEELVRGIEASFSDYQVTHDHRLVGEQIVMTESTFTGTHDGEFLDIPPTNERVKVPNMSILQIEDGKVQAHRGYYNPQEFLDQLGVTDE